MSRPVRTAIRAQAWVELITDDPAALSALAVARSRLPEGRRLLKVRRLRLFELEGAVAARGALEDLMHRSTWFYNPHKERCSVRLDGADPAPLAPDEQAVLVVERGGERRPAAERWWRHETGGAIEVREAIVYALRFEAGEEAAARTEELAVVRGPQRGLLCNPNAQICAFGPGVPPLDWIRSAVADDDAMKGAE
jgi:hypothetical protein